MKFSCLCCTFLRPEQLANSVACFERLDYPAKDRELIILDDAGQYPTEPSGERWQVISVKRRFATLGQKRNALAALATRDSDAFVVWDDDDVYLPWTLKAHKWALSNGAEWSAPHIVLNEIREDPKYQFHKSKDLFHAAWSMSRDAFAQAGGYPWKNSGEDQALGGRMARLRIPAKDPTLNWPPYFVHRWGTSGSWHLSAYGSNGYEQIGRRLSPGQEVSNFTPGLNRNWSREVMSFLNASPEVENDDLCRHWRSSRPEIARKFDLPK